MLIRILAGTLVAAAAVMPAAHAQPCVGEVSIGYVCAEPQNVSVDPHGGPTVGDCVFLGPSTCTPVFVTAPGVVQSGPPARVCRPSC